MHYVYGSCGWVQGLFSNNLQSIICIDSTWKARNRLKQITSLSSAIKDSQSIRLIFRLSNQERGKRQNKCTTQTQINPNKLFLARNGAFTNNLSANLFVRRQVVGCVMTQHFAPGNACTAEEKTVILTYIWIKLGCRHGRFEYARH